MEKEMIDKLKAYIKANYESEHGSLTELDAEDNADDTFINGERRGKALIMYEVAQYIGLEVPELQDQKYDF